MIALAEALPDLAADMEPALLRIGRGDVVDQLREARIERWTYDDFANVACLYMAGAAHGGPDYPETVSIYDDLGINLDLDQQRRVARIEILDAREIATELQAAMAPSEHRP